MIWYFYSSAKALKLDYYKKLSSGKGFTFHFRLATSYGPLYVVSRGTAFENFVTKVEIPTRKIVISMDKSNTVVSAYRLYKHLKQYCSHPSICTLYLLHTDIELVFVMNLFVCFCSRESVVLKWSKPRPKVGEGEVFNFIQGDAL